MSKRSLYVEPYFSVRNYFEKNESLAAETNTIKVDGINGLIQHQLMGGIIIANPGDGKSRFLKELLFVSNENEREGIFIDLKELDLVYSLENSINKITKRCFKINSNLEDESIIDKRLLITPNFQLTKSSSNLFIFLDALDEINPSNHFEIIKKIKDFKAEFPSIKIFLSCRKYICKKYTSFLDDLSFHYIELGPFTYLQIEKYLQLRGFNTNEIDKITRKFGAKYNNISVISSPRILEIFVSIYQDKGAEVAIKMTKAELLETFIYKKLNQEDKIINSNQAEIVKRVLEKLALVMEIYHKKEITKDELMTFFDDIKSNLSSGFLQQVELKYFYERSLLIESGTTVRFENAEFQEYLAAKEISRLGNIEQVSFDLIFNQEISEFDNYWFNTLSYLVDFSSKLQLKIIEFISKRKSPLDLNVVPHVLTNSPKRLDELIDKKDFIFKTILNHFHLNERYMHNDSAERLAPYFTNDSEQILKENTKSENLIVKGNSIFVLGKILLNQAVVSEPFWKKLLVKILKEEPLNENLFHVSVEALGFFNDIDLFQKNFKFEEVASTGNNHIMRSYVRTVQSIDPNHPYTIDILIHELELDYSSYNSELILEITSYSGIKYFLEKFLASENCQQQFYNYIYEKHFYDTLVKNIELVLDDDILDLLKKIKPTNHEDYFFKKVLKLICRKDEKYLLSFLERNILDDFDHRYLLEKNFFDFVDKKNIKTIISHYKKDTKGLNLLLISLMYIKRDDKNNHSELIIITEKSLAKEIKVWQKEREELRDQLDKQGREIQSNQYQIFQEKLQNAITKNSWGVFDFYKNVHANIHDLLTKKERESLKNKAIEILKNTDFSNAKILGIKKGDTTSLYPPKGERAFSLILRLTSELDIKITPELRKQIIQYLPFSLLNGASKNIFELIPTLSNDEVKYLMKFYSEKRDDDLLVFNFTNLFETCKHYNLTEFVPVIFQIAVNLDLPSNNRWHAIKTLEDMLEEKCIPHFVNMFEHYKTKTEKTKAYHLNRFRLKHPSYYHEAFDWQMSEIEKLIKKYNPKNINERDPLYYFDVHLRKPLQENNDIDKTDAYIRLFHHTMRIAKKGDEYYDGAKCLWDCIFSFLTNLKPDKSMTPYKKMEQAVQKHSKYKGIDILKRMLIDLKFQYLQEVAKPNTFSSCVQKYNEFKNQQYLNIVWADDLLFLIKDIIENDIANWVENEGAYKFISKTKGWQEDLIQKTILSQFQKSLLQRGFREHEIYIRREEQLLDDKRTDFVISYGFVGQILIEVKRTNNVEVHRKTTSEKYRQKLLQYIHGTKSENGIFLIFQVDENFSWANHKTRIEKIYEQDDNIYVLGYNCLGKKSDSQNVK